MKKTLNALFSALFVLLAVWTVEAAAAGQKVSYTVNGKPFEGYLVMPTPKAQIGRASCRERV